MKFYKIELIYRQNLIFNLIIVMMFFTMISCNPHEESSYDEFILLNAYYDSGAGGSSLRFRMDGTFEWQNGSFVDSPKDGLYSIKDSTITLRGMELSRALKSNILLVTRKNPHQQKAGEKILLQVNGEGEIIDSIFIFTVNIDMRDSTR